MLKIQRWEEDGQTGFSLSGRIEASHLPELERLFSAEGSGLVLDLQQVTLVATEVVRFLGECEAGGITLRNCPAYIRVWIAQQG